MCQQNMSCGSREYLFAIMNSILAIMGIMYILNSTSKPDPSIVVGFCILTVDMVCLCLTGWKRPAGQMLMVVCKVASVLWLMTEGIGSLCTNCPYDLSASLLTIFGAILLTLSSGLSAWSAVIACFCTGSADLESGDTGDIQMS
jgi:hypothetical protein